MDPMESASQSDRENVIQIPPVDPVAAPELSVPEAPAEEAVAEVNDSGILEIALYRPLTVNGIERRRLTLDVGGLCEIDMAHIDGEMRAAKDNSPRNIAFSTGYCMRIAAKACGINYNDLRRLSLKDSIRIQNALQNFLMV